MRMDFRYADYADIFSKYVDIFCRATLVQRPEFCLVIARLRRSCGGFKREGIEINYPGLCNRLGGILKT